MHIVILGNGISGVTCARFLRKLSDHDITIVSDESDEFFSRTALMYVYMGHMRLRDTMPYEPWFWEKNRIQRVRARVERIDFQQKKLLSTEGNSIGYDKLVIALGSQSNKFGWPGQDLDGVHGLYHLQDLEAMERHSAGLSADKAGGRAAIVGGGLIGIEMAEMFHSRKIPVTFLVREKAFWNNILPEEEAEMVTRHIKEHHIDLRLETELKEILSYNALPEGKGTCAAIVTNKGETIPCGFVGLTVGVSPNIGFLKNTALETNKGVLVDEHLQTNLPDVFAIGDCAELREPQNGRRSIEAIWYTGRMMGETAAYNLIADLEPQAQRSIANRPTFGKPMAGKKSKIENRKSYRPGIWFNSAKFFDIEYQVYGDIRTQVPDIQSTLYWEHPNGKKSIRINYEHESGKVVGFNLMGVRYRHEVCTQWIQEGAPIETVLQQLGLANFDPEFSTQYEAEIVAIYNRQTGKNLILKQRRGLSAVLEFLTH
ncbi:MAG: FAD/NAD(P)-binding oxidoreductase [Saprospiraceae bacterium]|nr:FAD/NAD(P)-binding oxidoreductase [Saprospiraceae bacterium]